MQSSKGQDEHSLVDSVRVVVILLVASTKKREVTGLYWNESGVVVVWYTVSIDVETEPVAVAEDDNGTTTDEVASSPSNSTLTVTYEPGDIAVLGTE